METTRRIRCLRLGRFSAGWRLSHDRTAAIVGCRNHPRCYYFFMGANTGTCWVTWLQGKRETFSGELTKRRHVIRDVCTRVYDVNVCFATHSASFNNRFHSNCTDRNCTFGQTLSKHGTLNQQIQTNRFAFGKYYLSNFKLAVKMQFSSDKSKYKNIF